MKGIIIQNPASPQNFPRRSFSLIRDTAEEDVSIFICNINSEQGNLSYENESIKK
jgi:hypothetical protein